MRRFRRDCEDFAGDGRRDGGHPCNVIGLTPNLICHKSRTTYWADVGTCTLNFGGLAEMDSGIHNYFYKRLGFLRGLMLRPGEPAPFRAHRRTGIDPSSRTDIVVKGQKNGEPN